MNYVKYCWILLKIRFWEWRLGRKLKQWQKEDENYYASILGSGID